MAQPKKKTKLYTKREVVSIFSEVLADLTIKLEDPSLVIAGMLAMNILHSKLK